MSTVASDGGGREREKRRWSQAVEAAEKAAKVVASDSGGGGGTGGNKALEEMAFWMALAVMGTEAERRGQRGESSGKKAKGDDGDEDGKSAAGHEGIFDGRFDAYLSSLPREGPDPCCWSAAERSTLLGGTPLEKQVDATLTKVKAEYDRVVVLVTQMRCGIHGGGKGKDKDTTVPAPSPLLPPFSIGGKGVFPSVLWARSVHQSRSFPRSLLDEEGVWWVGRKQLVGGDMLECSRKEEAVEEEEVEEDAAEADAESDNVRSGGAVLRVRLGGWRAPRITCTAPTEEDSPPTDCNDGATGDECATTDKDALDPPTPSPPSSTITPTPQKGSNLGIMLPLFDMLDHKPGHPVQWEASNKRIRFRCVDAIPKGGRIWNNYGPKGNGELLVTYGFASRENPLDSV